MKRIFSWEKLLSILKKSFKKLDEEAWFELIANWYVACRIICGGIGMS